MTLQQQKHTTVCDMRNKGKVVALRLENENEAWILGKSQGKRGKFSELINLAVTEMRQGMEALEQKTTKRKVK